LHVELLYQVVLDLQWIEIRKMLRFSMRKKDVKKEEEEEEAMTESSKEIVRVNYTSRAWLASLRKRTLSVESLSNMFSGVGRQDHGRRESLNSAGGSLTGGGNTKLMRTHKMQTKSGEPVEIYFGYDALSVNGRSIPYGDVVFWSHSASHFTMTYLSKTSGRRKDIVLYPTDKGPKPSDLTDMLGKRIARLVADQTGCSEEKAIRMATAKANESELREAVQALDQHQQESLLTEWTSPIKKQSSSNLHKPYSGVLEKQSSGVLERNVSGVLEKQVSGAFDLRKDNSGMIELKTSAPAEPSYDDGANSIILEVDETQPTPL